MQRLWRPQRLLSTTATAGARAAPAPVTIRQQTYQCDATTNVSRAVLSKVDGQLLHQPNHPLKIIKDNIFQYFRRRNSDHAGQPSFVMLDAISPVVTTQQNFDSVLVPADHPSRSQNDNYFINKTHMLRAHTSAHQVEHLAKGLRAFLIAGDVYRRDEIDRTKWSACRKTTPSLVADTALRVLLTKCGFQTLSCVPPDGGSAPLSAGAGELQDWPAGVCLSQRRHPHRHATGRLLVRRQ
jgi:phenylalanyl-tRNA synthetase alpha subunit